MAIRDKNEIVAFLKAHKDEMAQRFGVVSVGLFGSYARGDARDDSDIDIAIELRPEKKSLSNFLGVRRYLEQEFGKKVDLGIESTLKPLARAVVDREIIHV
jgi:predicted nucleotidyltransferase